MSLYHYLVRLDATLRSRQDIKLTSLKITVLTSGATFKANLHFYNNSSLVIFEELQVTGLQTVERERYKFHYQAEHETLVFRYDNSPHYPHVSTYPHHKHIGNQVVAANPPDLNEVLTEIDTFIHTNIKNKGG